MGQMFLLYLVWMFGWYAVICYMAIKMSRAGR